MEVSVKKKHFIGVLEIVFALCLAGAVTIGRSVYNFNTVFGLMRAPKENAAVFLFLFIPLLLVFAFAGRVIRKNAAKKAYSKEELPAFYKWFPLIASVLVCASSTLAVYLPPEVFVVLITQVALAFEGSVLFVYGVPLLSPA